MPLRTNNETSICTFTQNAGFYITIGQTVAGKRFRVGYQYRSVQHATMVTSECRSGQHPKCRFETATVHGASAISVTYGQYTRPLSDPLLPHFALVFCETPDAARV
jgi:hypothetical protein